MHIHRRSLLAAMAAVAVSPAGARAPKSGAPHTPVRKAVSTARHTTSYLEAGSPTGTPVVLVHGWPHIAHMWRRQIATLSAAGYRVIAPDLRGCGMSTVHSGHDSYAQREIVRDMIELADALKLRRAVWIGHDWGAIVVSNLARHHPARCIAVGGISQPFNSLEMGSKALVPLVNRDIYPADTFPYGQFEYMPFYQEHFEDAEHSFDGDVSAMLRAVMRGGVAGDAGKPFLTAFVRKQGGWFGPAGKTAPDLPLDTSVMTPEDLSIYLAAFGRTGFFGINSFYMNDDSNAAYYAEAPTDLAMPVLFLTGRYDYVCDSEHSRLAAPMRLHCSSLSYVVLDAGHWLPQESADGCSSAILHWLNTKIPSSQKALSA